MDKKCIKSEDESSRVFLVVESMYCCYSSPHVDMNEETKTKKQQKQRKKLLEFLQT